MMEKAKSVLLLCLVGLSLFMTYQLWYGQKPLDPIIEDDFERIFVETPRILTDIINPSRIVIRVEGGYYILRESDSSFNQLWEMLSQIMQGATRSSITDQADIDAELQNLMVVYLKPLLPAGEDLPWLTGVDYSLLNRLEVKLANDEQWLLVSKTEINDDLTVMISSLDQEKLGELVADIIASERTLYSQLSEELVFERTAIELNLPGSIYIPEESITMEFAQFRPEIIDRNRLLKTFFVDYSMARIIEEKDGSLIYTDGDRGLRLSRQGLEFTNPRVEERHTSSVTFSYVDALISSSNYLSYHGGWPADLRLESLGLTGWGPTASYLAEWRLYYRGYPLYLTSPTRAFFNDRGLFHYTRTHLIAENSTESESIVVAQWEDALESAFTYFDRKQANLKALPRLEMLELGYVLTGEAPSFQAEPVWLVQINDFTFLLEADTLDLINGEKIL